MGLKIPPLPEDYGPGNDCLACHSPGLTPKYVTAFFDNIDTCPGYADPPNSFTFYCEQTELNPCAYIGYLLFEEAYWRCVYYATVDYLGVQKATISLHRWDPAQSTSFYGVLAPCGLIFDTSIATCPAWAGFGGNAVVDYFADYIIVSLTSAYHFVTIPGIFYEKMDVGMDHAVYRIAHPRDKTNVLIYLDKEHIEYD